MKTKRLIAAILITLAALSACHKDKTAAITGSIKTIFDQTRTPSQFFTISASTTKIVVGSKGTILTFYANSFRTPAGAPVTGNVQIELKELYKKGDMLLSNYTTTSNGRLLGSGGELFVKATQNGQELILQSPYRIQMPAYNYNPNMQAFAGVFVADSSNGGDSTLNWIPLDTASSITIIPADSSVTNPNPNPPNVDYYYNFYCYNLNFINCDYFYGYSQPLTGITITCNTGFNGSNCKVYIAYTTINAIANIYDDPYYTSVFDGVYASAPGYEMPVGMSVTLVAIALKNGQYYSAFSPVTIAQNGSYSITLTPTTMPAFVSAVNAL